MIELSENQKKIATFEKGSLLVLASAGSGKTRVLTERIKFLIQKTKRKILAITFTNKASEEIKERLSEVENLHEKTFIGTFHSFCSYVLENHGNSIGYAKLPQIFNSDDDRMKIIEEAVSLTPRMFDEYALEGGIKFKRQALDIISEIKREIILDEELEKKYSFAEITLYRNYNSLMKSLNAIDFDDLLYLVYQLFISNPNIAALYRRSFEYICIDEAQDLNKAQYMVLKALTGNEHKNVMLVGDPKQSIFGFNGSNSSFMKESFENDYSPTVITLNENYRSSKAVLEYANKLIPNSSEISEIMKQGICELTNFPSTEEEALSVVSRIKKFLEKKNLEDIEGEIIPSRIATIARNKYILNSVEENLKKENIPYFYKNNINGIEFESTSGKIFDLALLFRINPQDTLHFQELTQIMNMQNCDTLQELINNSKNEFTKLILETVLLLNDDGTNFNKQIQKITKEIQENTKNSDEIDELNLAYSDFSTILKQWYQYATTTSNKSIGGFHNSMALGQTNVQVEKQGVILSTVHTMKGQEADIVFLIGMDDLTFPDYRAVRKGGFDLEQEKNDLYVAITRAKRYLYISYPEKRIMPWGDVSRRYKSRLLP